VVREKRVATKRDLAAAERAEAAAITKAAQIRVRDKIEEEAERKYLEEFEHNPNAVPDSCLAPDPKKLDKQAKAKRCQARATWFSLYAVYILNFALPDGFDETIDSFGTASERIALMSILARLGYQIVHLDTEKREIIIRRCDDGECQTGYLLMNLSRPESDEMVVDCLPPAIMQEIKQWAAVRFDVELGFRPDGTYGEVGTINRETPILPYFPIRFQRPELWSDDMDWVDLPFWDYPKGFDNYVYPRHPP